MSANITFEIKDFKKDNSEVDTGFLKLAYMKGRGAYGLQDQDNYRWLRLEKKKHERLDWVIVDYWGEGDGPSCLFQSRMQVLKRLIPLCATSVEDLKQKMGMRTAEEFKEVTVTIRSLPACIFLISVMEQNTDSTAFRNSINEGFPGGMEAFTTLRREGALDYTDLRSDFVQALSKQGYKVPSGTIKDMEVFFTSMLRSKVGCNSMSYTAEGMKANEQLINRTKMEKMIANIQALQESEALAADQELLGLLNGKSVEEAKEILLETEAKSDDDRSVEVPEREVANG